jgi:hypothetical protein
VGVVAPAYIPGFSFYHYLLDLFRGCKLKYMNIIIVDHQKKEIHSNMHNADGLGDRMLKQIARLGVSDGYIIKELHNIDQSVNSIKGFFNSVNTDDIYSIEIF